jgi:hypothetical protein
VLHERVSALRFATRDWGRGRGIPCSASILLLAQRHYRPDPVECCFGLKPKPRTPRRQAAGRSLLTKSDRPGTPGRVIAFDGKHSCPAGEPCDRLDTNALVSANGVRRSRSPSSDRAGRDSRGLARTPRHLCFTCGRRRSLARAPACEQRATSRPP